MRLIILDSSKDVAEWSAKYVLKRINDFKPGPNRYFVLGLPTGKNMTIRFCYLSFFYKENKLRLEKMFL